MTSEIEPRWWKTGAVVVLFSEEFLDRLDFDGEYDVLSKPVYIPADAYCQGMSADFSREAVAFRLKSESLPPLMWDAVSPTVSPVLVSRPGADPLHWLQQIGAMWKASKT